MKMLIGFCLVCLPLKHLIINSNYGYRVHPLTGKFAMHYGVDLQARSDTVYALMDATVLQAGYDNYLGLNVRLKHIGDLTSIYGHGYLWFRCLACRNIISPDQPAD